MKNFLPALIATMCLGVAGCLQHGSIGPGAASSASAQVPDDSYVVEGYYSAVLDQIKDKMRECELYQHSSRFYLDSGKREAYYVIFGGLGAVVFKTHLQYKGDKETAVHVYAPQGDAEWAMVAEAVRRGAFNAPGCPAKE